MVAHHVGDLDVGSYVGTVHMVAGDACHMLVAAARRHLRPWPLGAVMTLIMSIRSRRHAVMQSCTRGLCCCTADSHAMALGYIAGGVLEHVWLVWESLGGVSRSIASCVRRMSIIEVPPHPRACSEHVKVVRDKQNGLVA